MQTFRHRSFLLEYSTYGSGQKPLLAFHGFGQHADVFRVFLPLFGERYTIYSFNLFHHGNSQYPPGRIKENTLTKDEWSELILAFTEHEKIDQYGLLAYSLGGKLALMLAEMCAHQIDMMYLFAPDGIKKNFWYYFASNTAVGKSSYGYILDHPAFFFKLVTWCRKTGLINRKVERFALQNMDSHEKRQLVRDVWLTFRKTNPNMKKVIEEVKLHQIPVVQCFGKYDRIIPPRLGSYFSRAINQPDGFYVIPTGHDLLSEKTVRFLQKKGVN